MDQYEQYVRQELLKEASAKGQVGQTLGTMFSGIASHFVADATLRHDYFIASIFEAEFGDNHLRALGILNHFIKLDPNGSIKSSMPDSKKSTGPQGAVEKPAEQTVTNVGKKAEINTVRHNFEAGPVKVSVQSKCSPLMEDCESDAELHYRSQVLKIDSVGWQTHPIAEDEVSWVDNRYITIDHGNGGNCYACEGVAVAQLDGDHLSYLGKFKTVKDGYLIGLYDVLENNALTSHAAAPGWRLYFKPVKQTAVLDIDYTCRSAKEDFVKNKKRLMEAISIPKHSAWINKNDPRRQLPTLDQIVEPLLSTLSLARYCGWQDEYLEILTAAKSSPNKILTWNTLEAVSTELAKVEPPQPR